MSELGSRRERKKAQTRQHIRRTAQALFAEHGFEAVTIADIAAASDVAVQTVFNHFATKEELFFSDRTPWREGPADAVRTRDENTGPLAALRAYLIGMVESAMQRASTPEHRRLIAVLQASPGLLDHEPVLHREAESRVRRALQEAWENPRGALDRFVPEDPRTAAALVAAVWIGAMRALLVEQRCTPPEPGDTAATTAVVRYAEFVLDRLEQTFYPALQRRPEIRRVS